MPEALSDIGPSLVCPAGSGHRSPAQCGLNHIMLNRSAGTCHKEHMLISQAENRTLHSPIMPNVASAFEQRGAQFRVSIRE